MIMTLLKVYDLKDIHLSDVNPIYMETPRGCEYRPFIIQELIDVKHQVMDIPGFDETEINAILNFLCVD